MRPTRSDREILFYVVGPVHPKNMALLAAAMPDHRFRMIYEPWLSKRGQIDLPDNALPFVRDQVPRGLSPDSIAAVVFSTVQPRRAPLNLLYWALRNNLPAIAIEESNQLALNSGRYCNYLAPLDHLLVASGSERDYMLALGMPAERIHITGWPFCSASGAVDSGTRRAAKGRLGLDPEAPVAALTLTAYADSGETERVRITQLRMASDGLPADYQLVVKPHPIESMDVLRRFVSMHARGATILDGTTSIDSVLDATDVLLNRGVSQVAFEALFKGIPVVVLDVGNRTLFHDSAPECVAGSSTEVSQVVRRIEAADDAMALYQAVFDRHIPSSPDKAREMVRQKIVSIVEGPAVHRCEEQWLEFALTYAWQVDRLGALHGLKHASSGGVARALGQLLRREATSHESELLADHWHDTYGEQMVLGLVCEQLCATRSDVQPFHLDLMQRLFGTVNPHLFCRHYELWARLLIDSGNMEQFRIFREELDSRRHEVHEFGAAVERMDRYSRGRLHRCLVKAGGFRTTVGRGIRSMRQSLIDPFRE